MIAPYSTYDVHDLMDYFEKALPRPTWCPGITRLESASLEVEGAVAGVPVTVNILAPFVRAWNAVTEGSRVNSTAWMWLRPNDPSMTLADVPALQRAAGLDHLHAAAFATRVIGRCKHLSREHQALALWIARRIALLELVASPPSEPAAELKHTASALRRSVQTALCYLSASAATADASTRASRAASARELARDILQKAMDGAAEAVKSVFTSDACSLSANLMIPTKCWDLIVDPEERDTELVKRNSAAAEALWDCELSGERLVIVAETVGSLHRGFWLPLIRGDGCVTLPGAAEAYAHREGAAVFVDDLPLLKGFPEKLARRWQAYMASDFSERMFVSLPFQLPTGVRARAILAVLNVNITARDLTPWRRAYHAEWLRVARDRVDPFVEVAYDALRVIYSDTQGAAFDSLSGAWDRLLAARSR